MLLRLFLMVLGTMAVVLHQAQPQQQQQGTTNTNFDDAALTDSLKDMTFKDEMKELFHTWRQEFAVEYKTAKELEERMEVWLQNHGMCFLGILVVLAVLCVFV